MPIMFKMKKILYLLDRPNLQGAEQHVFDLICYMQKKHKVKLIAFRPGPLLHWLEERNVNCEIIDFKGWIPSLGICNRLRKLFKEAELIHAHQPKAILWSSLLRAGTESKLINTIHSLPESLAMIYDNPFRYYVTYWFHKTVQFVAESGSDYSIFITRTTKKRAFWAGKARQIYNWLPVKIDVFGCNQQDASQTLPSRFLYIGSLSQSKGMIDLINLFVQIKQINPLATLTIAGTGEPAFCRLLKEKIAEKGLGQSVVLAGFTEEINKYYAAHDCFISMTKSETFGLVFIEAMAFSLPVITSDLPVLREIIPASNLFFNADTMDEAAIRLFLNQALAVGLSNRSYVQRHFNYQIQMRKYEQIYHKVLSID